MAAVGCRAFAGGGSVCVETAQVLRTRASSVPNAASASATMFRARGLAASSFSAKCAARLLGLSKVTFLRAACMIHMRENLTLGDRNHTFASRLADCLIFPLF